MIDIIIGIAIGAAFAPFWINAWSFIKAALREFFSKKQEK